MHNYEYYGYFDQNEKEGEGIEIVKGKEIF